MEKICEFCAGLRPVIYCKSDAAHLCLSCDAKVHSANELSGRHLRTLLCDLCKNFPTYLLCSDHQMFLCRNCDRSLHDPSSQHQKRIIRGYIGCLSARDFAALCGFKLNELDDTSRDLFVLSSGSEASAITTLDSCSTHVSTAERKTLYKGQEHRIFILQQILDLNRFELTKGNNHSPFISREGKDGIPSSVSPASEKFDESPNQHSKDLGADVQQRDHLLLELKTTPLPFSFCQLENFPQSSAIVIPLHGDSLWQCKSSAESSQLWSQNMQDLGVCDDLGIQDDFNIPEVDLTFQDFEDIFDGDQDPIRGELDSKNESCSSMDKDTSLDKSDNHHGKAVEELSVTSSTHIFTSALMNKDQVCNPSSTESACPIRPTSSSLSVSDSRLSFESSGSECLDSRMVGEPSCSSPFHCHQEQHEHSMASNNAAMRNHRERKQSQMQRKQNYRKARSLVRKRVKGGYAKTEPYDSDIIVVSRSY